MYMYHHPYLDVSGNFEYEAKSRDTLFMFFVLLKKKHIVFSLDSD